MNIINFHWPDCVENSSKLETNKLNIKLKTLTTNVIN